MANKEVHQQGDSTKQTDASHSKSANIDVDALHRLAVTLPEVKLDHTKVHLPDVQFHDTASHKPEMSVNKDNGLVIKNSDGSSTTLNLDGSRVETNKDGNVTDVDHGHGKGKEHIEYEANGKDIKSVTLSDGQSWTKNPKGGWDVKAHGKTFSNQDISEVKIDEKTGDLSWTNNKNSKDMKHPEEHRKVTVDGTFVKDTNKLPIEPTPTGESKLQDQMVLNEAKTMANLLDMTPPDPAQVNASLEALNKLGPEYAKKVYEAMTEPEKSQVAMTDVLQADGTIKSELMLKVELKPALPEIPNIPIGPGGQRPPEGGGIVPPADIPNIPIGPGGQRPPEGGGIVPPDIGPQRPEDGGSDEQAKPGNEKLDRADNTSERGLGKENDNNIFNAFEQTLLDKMDGVADKATVDKLLRGIIDKGIGGLSTPGDIATLMGMKKHKEEWDKDPDHWPKDENGKPKMHKDAKTGKDVHDVEPPYALHENEKQFLVNAIEKYEHSKEGKALSPKEKEALKVMKEKLAE